jgi:hypothetical protein
MLVDTALTGVFVSDRPVDANAGAHGDVLMQLQVDGRRIRSFEVVEMDKGYREWCLPAALLNATSSPRILTEAEADRLETKAALRWVADLDQPLLASDSVASAVASDGPSS